MSDADFDAIEHPQHYNRFPGVEVIDLTQHLGFCLGANRLHAQWGAM